MPAVLKDLASGQVFDLGEFCLVGRSDGATVRLSDASISRQHASIRREDSGYWVVDLGSANGTYVNNAALSAARRLADGDRLQFGGLVMQFEERGDHVAPVAAFTLDARTQIAVQAPEPLRAQRLTLLVADLKDFTALGSRLSAGEVADLLREWYGGCERILRARGASIDKFIGDCVFAYWHSDDAAARRSAADAASQLRGLRSTSGIELDCRVGLHVGTAAIGAMGKGVTTALGDAVNMAFRIERLTRDADAPVLASADFVEGWAEGGQRFRARGRFPVKGYEGDIAVFAPAQPGPDQGTR